MRLKSRSGNEKLRLFAFRAVVRQQFLEFGSRPERSGKRLYLADQRGLAGVDCTVALPRDFFGSGQGGQREILGF